MEVILGQAHKDIPIDEPSRVGEARRLAVKAASAAGWSELDAGRLALVVTELGTNLVKHARHGRLLIAVQEEGRAVEILSIDSGPGIADMDRCMGDGYSSGASPGTGLGGILRMADEFDIHSTVPAGTVAVARVRVAGAASTQRGLPLQVGAVCIAVPGEEVSGDTWGACLSGSRATLMVADGLGHGPGAHEASQAAASTFRSRAGEDLRLLMQQTHEALRPTRGAAVSYLRADATAGQVNCVSVGNVIARVVSGSHDKTLLSLHGTVGMQVRNLQETSNPWPEHALLIVHSDGIETRWSTEAIMPLLGRDPSLVAATILRDHCRGRDDATVVVLRRRTTG